MLIIIDHPDGNVCDGLDEVLPEERPGYEEGKHCRKPHARRAVHPLGESFVVAGGKNGRHKHLDQGYHVFLTFNHLTSHRGAFPVTNGSWWNGKNYGAEAPKWSKWTGDPDKDNYAHARPGTL